MLQAMRDALPMIDDTMLPALLLLAAGALLAGVRAALARAARQKLVRDVAAWTPASAPERLRRLSFTVIVNPGGSGAGRGEMLLRCVVSPMLVRAGVQHEVIRTKGAGHARQICAELSPSSPGHSRVVLCVSGDGMVHEALNGLLSGSKAGAPRTDALLAVVPAGSGNGVCASLYGRAASHDPVAVMARILDGAAPQPIDVMAMRYLDEDSGGGGGGSGGRARTRSQASFVFDLHFVCWAIFSDHDYLVEGPLRRLGPLVKLAIAPIAVLLRLRCHRGVCDFAPVAPEPAHAAAYSDAAALPVCPDEPSMRRLEGDFLCWALGNLSEAGGDACATPHVKQAEGAADLLICRSVPGLGRLSQRHVLFKLLDRMGSGRHVPAPQLEYYKTARLVLRPKSGHLQLSGQEVRRGPVEVVVHRAAIEVLM